MASNPSYTPLYGSVIFQDFCDDFDFGSLFGGIKIGSLRFEFEQVLKALNGMDVKKGNEPDTISLRYFLEIPPQNYTLRIFNL